MSRPADFGTSRMQRWDFATLINNGRMLTSPTSQDSTGDQRAPLQVLVLAGNKLKQLPEEIGQFKSLRKLQLAGNQLTNLPHIICTMTQLQV